MIPQAATLLPRNYLIGYFAPAAIAVSVGLLLVKFEPETTGNGEKLTLQLTFLFIVALLLSQVLRAFNLSIIRLYEGLGLFEHFFLFRWWRESVRNEYKISRDKINKQKEKGGASRVDAYEDLRDLLRRYPDSEDYLRATRLGNVIAAFEYYPYRRYRMDAILWWPHLLLVLPEKHDTLIAAAKTSLDFFINLSFLSYMFILVAPELTLLGLTDVGAMAATIVIGALIGYGSYRLTIARAIWWGETVKAAFDLYRLNILRCLGVSAPNGEFKADWEREVWEELEWGMELGRAPTSITFQLGNDRKSNTIDRGAESEGSS